jgi:hypothetical protein
MTPDSISDRVLLAWERGAGRSAVVRAKRALEILSAADCPTALFARDDALVRLRIALLGAELDAVVRCPGCDTEFDLPLDLSVFLRATPVATSVSIEADGFAATVRPPEAEDLDELPGDLSPEDFAAALFLRCVESATFEGRLVEASLLPPAIRAEAAAALAALGMESPFADLTCGECGHRWRAPIDIARVLWREIDAWAQRQLDEVHRIASAYHWCERDILALPPARRQFYLDAIG